MLIFVTSSFVVPFGTFIHFVQGLSNSLGFKQWFNDFWSAYWFFVVKGWHATEYAILVSLVVIILNRYRPGYHSSTVWIAFVFAVSFAASDEWHQTFVPGRDGCVQDVAIDSSGAFLATIFWAIRRPHQKQTSPNDPA